MRKKNDRVYRSFKSLKLAARILAAALIVAAALAVLLFFWFRQYIVYTQDGLKLDVPWLQSAEE